MPIDRHPTPRRPVGAIVAARRREKAALAARCRSFGAIAEAMAHYGRDRAPTVTSADRRGRWEALGDYAGVAASADAEGLRTASEGLRHRPAREHPRGSHGASERTRAAVPAARSAEELS